MKKRRHSYNHTLTHHLNEHAAIYLFVIVLFSIGVVFGAIVINSLGFVQKEELFYYLKQFFGQVIDDGVIDHKELFFQSFIHNSKFISLIWVLGVSVIGLPVILIFLFMKGMVIGFTVGFLVNQMDWHGFLLSFVAILPQNLLIVPIFIVAATLSITFSLKMIRKQFMKTSTQPIMPLFTRYIFTLAVSIMLLIVAAAIEAYVSPLLMKVVITSMQ